LAPENPRPVLFDLPRATHRETHPSANIAML
jgi:hypothetical protein